MRLSDRDAATVGGEHWASIVTDTCTYITPIIGDVDGVV